MSKINSREKGKRGELEIANKLKSYGYDTRRTAQYCGNTGEASDVVGVPGIHIEVKFVEAFRDEVALQQAERDARKGEIPIVHYRRSREKWKVCMRMDLFYLMWGELTDLQKHNIMEKIKFSAKSEKIGKQR